jgi:septal ring-binding cell division protein DamX
MVPDRRQYQRLTPSAPQLVLLDESKYSLLFDLSEGGLAVEGFAAHNPDRALSLEFDMPEGSCCVQAKAEIVWTSDSGYRTGFRFVELSDNSREQLRNWVSATSASRSGAVGAEEAQPNLRSEDPEAAGPIRVMDDRQPERYAEQRPAESSLFPLQPALKPRFQRPFAIEDDDVAPEGSALHLASIFVAAVVLSSIAFIMGYYWHAGRPRTPVKPSTAISQPLARSDSATSSTTTAPSAAQNAIPPMLPLDTPGFVLQVGAMGQESNADALSNDLRKKNFSSFVFHRGTDPLYRVAVGPYTTQSAAIRIQHDLEQEGYKPILKPWSPQ